MISRKENPRYPFTQYPRGWFRVGYSDELRRGQVLSVPAFGTTVALYRGEDGAARALRKQCPHLGADLGIGRVVGNHLQCRFHGWEFEGSGACVKIPGVSVIPQKAQCGAYPLKEQDNHIYVWFASDGRPPEFDLEPHPAGLDDPKWGRRLKHEWLIRMHPQEVAENLVDTEHFPIVHNYDKKPPLDFRWEDHRLIAHMDSRRYGRFTGPSPTSISYQGFGVTHADVRSVFGVHMAVVLSTTPVSNEHTRITIQTQVEKYRIPGVEAVIRQFVYKEILEDFANDIPIWETKDYLSNPLWSKADGPIWEIRKWAKQFYD